MSITLELPAHVTSLATAGVLVTVSVEVWAGTKSDNTIADRVSADAGATAKVGKWSHDLLAGDPDLRAVLNHRQAVYNFLSATTYDWMGKLRYLPSSNVERFRAGYDSLTAQWEQLLAKLFNTYEDKVAAQAFVRGALFNRADYPTVDELRKRYSMSVTYAEVPVGDFRVQIAADLAADMRNNLQRQMEDQIALIHTRQVEQLRAVMQSLSKGCEIEHSVGDDGQVTVRRHKIYDTTVRRAIELCDTFEQFNPRGDQLLTQVRDELYQTLREVDAQTLRASDSLRVKVKTDIDGILSKFQF